MDGCLRQEAREVKNSLLSLRTDATRCRCVTWPAGKLSTSAVDVTCHLTCAQLFSSRPMRKKKYTSDFNRRNFPLKTLQSGILLLKGRGMSATSQHLEKSTLEGSAWEITLRGHNGSMNAPLEAFSVNRSNLQCLYQWSNSKWYLVLFFHKFSYSKWCRPSARQPI